MINFVVECVESIIIAIIFVIIIEMLLPNGANKKYVQMISGIYLMFTILNPFLGLFNKEIDIDLFENYKSVETSVNMTDEKLKSYYIESLKTTMKSQLKELGFDVNKINVLLDSTGSEITQIIIKGARANNFEEIKNFLFENYGVDLKNIVFS